MRCQRARECDQLAASSLGQIITIEVLEFVFAHVQGSRAGIVEGNELAITARHFELTYY